MGCACCKEDDGPLDGDVDLMHFHLLRSVGKGAFGKVRIVQKKDDKTMYALKYINKDKCIKMKAVENIIQERKLLEEVEHPFMVNLRYAFQDDENMFMVIDLMLGGDLRYHLDRQFSVPEKTVKFYMAEAICGLLYMHSHRICHRDIKPDNLLLDEKGHIHFTDFNIAVYLPETDKKLKSVAGTMAYMAPEILRKTGYLETVDWWSMGVVMYECLFGKRPFRGKTNEALCASIIHDPINLPKSSEELSPDCVSFLLGLLERDENKRLGVDGGAERIKAHPWFSDIDWDLVEAKEMEAPFVPDQKRANFDATYELEELLLEDNPLRAKKRATRPEGFKLSKEMQLIEDKFLPYNTNPYNGKIKKTEEEINAMMNEAEMLERAREENPEGLIMEGPLSTTATRNTEGEASNTAAVAATT